MNTTKFTSPERSLKMPLRFVVLLGSLIPMAMGLVSSVFANTTDFATHASAHARQLAWHLEGRESIDYRETQAISHTSLDQASFDNNSTVDIRLSESVSPANFDQRSPDICQLSDGTFVAVWSDNREGAYKIYAQRISGVGVPLSGNVKIAERADGYDLLEPQIVATVSAKFYLGYRDEAAGQIRVARFTNTLVVDLPDFEASESITGAYAGPFSIDAQANGRFVVTYEEYDSGNLLKARKFNADGSINGSTITVNSDGGLDAHWYPQVAFEHPDFAFAVAWEDYREGTGDIYFRRFDSLGAPVAGEISLIDNAFVTAEQYAPALTFSPLSGYVAGWTDTRNGTAVYYQRFSKQIGLVGANTRISADDPATIFTDCRLAVDADDRWNACYGAYGASTQTLLQRFDAGSAPIGVAKVFNSGTSGTPSAANFIVGNGAKYGGVWVNSLSGGADVRFHLLDSTGAGVIPSSIQLNSDISGATSDQPEVTTFGGTRVATVFRSQRIDGGDIYVQLTDLSGALIGANRRVNADAPGARQSDPAIGSTPTAMLVAWTDQRVVSGQTGTRIFARIGSNSGVFLTSEFQVSGSDLSSKSDVATALCLNGEGLVAWMDHRSGAAVVYGQYVTLTGTLLGTEFQISDPVNDIDNVSLSVSCDSLNRFRVSWVDRGAAGGVRIRTQAYSVAAGHVGTLDLISDQAGVKVEDADLAVNQAGDMYILWQGKDNSGVRRLYVTVRRFNGITLLSSTEVPTSLAANPEKPSVSVDAQGYALAAWIDYRAPERRVFYRMYTPALAAIGGEQAVTLSAIPAMFAPSVVASRGRSWFTWTDARTQGMNVYLNGFVHSPTIAEDDTHSSLPETFTLQQNYPNPFNPTTAIAFTLPYATTVEIEIFNTLGARVRQLISGRFDAGQHQVTWNGLGDSGELVASGVYFYRLKSESFTATRKMALLK